MWIARKAKFSIKSRGDGGKQPKSHEMILVKAYNSPQMWAYNVNISLNCLLGISICELRYNFVEMLKRLFNLSY